jgi:hypothetical protein
MSSPKHPYSTQDGRPICFGCKKPGHIARDCPYKEESEEEKKDEQETLYISCLIASDKEPDLTEVQCLDQKIGAFFSTGSTASCMTKSLWKKLNCPMMPWDETNLVASYVGGKIPYLGVVNLPITVDGLTATGRIFVVEHSPVDLILGMDVMDQLMEQGSMSIRNVNGKMTFLFG